MEKRITLVEKKSLLLASISFTTLAFVTLFFTETSYYLLILQTGIVNCFHSDMSKIWMIPIGGILGILLISTIRQRSIVVSIALFMQTLLMFFYPAFNGIMLFILGVLSGLIAPYLIYQLKDLKQIVLVLGLAYLLGTFAVNIPAEQRGLLAIILSIVALFSSYFVVPSQETKRKITSYQPYIIIFIWLVLDATLFETLARSSHGIWAHEKFTLSIALFHLIGLYMGYKLSNYHHNNRIVLTLFFLSYLFFAFNLTYLLVIVYPMVISYYNVLILKRFMTLSFEALTLVSLSLWLSAGMGLSLALLFHGSLFII